MKSSGDLGAVFRSHHRGALPDPLEGLEEALAAFVQRARDAWPELVVAPVAFVQYAAQRLPADLAPEEALSRTHAGDLYLACACAGGDAGAVAAFERRFLSRVPVYLSRLEAAASFIDEVQQALREKLFVAAGGATPRIAEYAGQGPLDAWVRIVAIRTALNLTRRERKHLPLDEGVADELTPSPDPELDFIKARYRRDFEGAFRAALSTLPTRDRNLLRLHFLDRLGIGELAAMHGVHRTTIARWLAGAQNAVLKETRRLLREKLRLTRTEFESLMGAVQSRLEITLHSLLKSVR